MFFIYLRHIKKYQNDFIPRQFLLLFQMILFAFSKSSQKKKKTKRERDN